MTYIRITSGRIAGSIAGRILFLSILFILLSGCGNTPQPKIRVAVASNFFSAAKEIERRFESRTGHDIVLSFGSTGAHYAQISNGAPFDIFLAADSDRPQLLIKQDLAVKGSQFTYAKGRLILWSAQPGLVDPDGKVLEKIGIRKIAIANPKLAPYGKAAMEVLEKVGLKNANPETKIIRGENVRQTFQFVSSENAEVGFVSFAQIARPESSAGGSYWMVPGRYYSPIRQDAVLLNDKPETREFMDFLKSKEIRLLIKEFGYGGV